MCCLEASQSRAHKRDQVCCLDRWTACATQRCRASSSTTCPSTRPLLRRAAAMCASLAATSQCCPSCSCGPISQHIQCTGTCQARRTTSRLIRGPVLGVRAMQAGSTARLGSAAPAVAEHACVQQQDGSPWLPCLHPANDLLTSPHQHICSPFRWWRQAGASTSTCLTWRRLRWSAWPASPAGPSAAWSRSRRARRPTTR